MVQIKSTIGDSSFQNPARKNYVVNDESSVPQNRTPDLPGVSGIPEGAREINPAMAASLRQQAMQKQEQAENRVLQEARRRIDIITGLGRKTRDVPIETDSGTIIFTLRTLKTFEQNCLAQVVESSERVALPDGRFSFTPTGMYKIKVEALSHSLYLIDSQSVDLVLGTANSNYDEQVNARKQLIDEMDGALIDHLFLQYEEVSKEAYDGYAPKTAEEAKEVVETIRKSSTDT